MQEQKPINWMSFLGDVFKCSLSAFGGPEAHYGVFSSVLVDQRKYLSEPELTEMIGVYALVPGPSSTQTITAIGYHVGGPVLAFLTFLVWAFPAILMMGLLGVFFERVISNASWMPLIRFLPAVAIGFIFYAAIRLTHKVVKVRKDVLLYIVMLILALLLVGLSMWVVPILLLSGGLVVLYPHLKVRQKTEVRIRPKWFILVVIVGLALLNEGLRTWLSAPWVTLYTSFYRYGYSVIGGGQIVIPLMIQDLVQTQSLISLSDFLSGYAIDQAIPGPLFSFAAFVSSRSFSGTGYAFLLGMVGGLSIFLPGILFVYLMFPLWTSVRKIPVMRHFLSGVTITAASLILMTAITQVIELPVDFLTYAIVIISTGLLLTRKVPAPAIVMVAAILGYLF